MFGILKKIFGTANDRIVKKLLKDVEQINAFEANLQKLSDSTLQNKTKEFKEALKNGKKLDDILHEAFAVVREASKRSLGMRHFDVQLMGGIILHRGMITEMRTGEGKTLVATLPAYLNALEGKGVHIVTVNDYLVRRDAESMGVLFNFLGLSVKTITSNMDESEKKEAYGADITYATNNELGFDYLRDNMKFTIESRVQRPFNFAIIDEVDSILIDEARTPLIISGPVDDNTELYTKINSIVTALSKTHYDIDEKTRTVNLNDSGIAAAEELLIKASMIQKGTSLYDLENMELVHYVNQALRAHNLFAKDVDYIVKNNQVMIIDEFTGRMMEGRRYSDGLHQALEAKERLPIQNENQTLASITFQNYFRMYTKLAGMTGTAMTEASELKEIYNLDVVAVPTHNPVKRVDHDDEIYGSIKEKSDAILKLIKNCYEKGQPVLVGTISIEKSEQISDMLTKNKIAHKVLNAKFHEQEASIIAQAGRFKSVTIATNMAGRGTDIMLGGNPEMLIKDLEEENLSAADYQKKVQEIKKQIADEKEKVIAAGGLFVLGTERHESRRIDNQLRGRSGRQGDPGETRFFLSLEDDLMRIFASERISGILRNLGLKDGEAIHHPMISRALEKAQQRVEAHNYEIRKNLLKFDDVMSDQRRIVYDQRNNFISNEHIIDLLYNMSEQVVSELVTKFIPKGSYREEWDLEGLSKEVYRLFGLIIDPRELASQEIDEEGITSTIKQIVSGLFKHKEEQFGSDVMKEGTRYVLIGTLDQVWKDHLLSLDHLRQGINLRAYGQKDPLNEYKREAFTLFEYMLDGLSYNFIQRMAHLHIDTGKAENKEAVSLKNKKLQKTFESRRDPAFESFNSGTTIETELKPAKAFVDPKDRDPSNPETWGKIARNEACPCGSDKKYKHCHGA
ncbi:MAG: secA [Rickettsiaceae bacterium]|jgi:preprotein translocase subunit SecA|nr:secA [Rickettsiaceae bacterium]